MIHNFFSKENQLFYFALFLGQTSCQKINFIIYYKSIGQ